MLDTPRRFASKHYASDGSDIAKKIKENEALMGKKMRIARAGVVEEGTIGDKGEEKEGTTLVKSATFGLSRILKPKGGRGRTLGCRTSSSRCGIAQFRR